MCHSSLRTQTWISPCMYWGEFWNQKKTTISQIKSFEYNRPKQKQVLFRKWYHSLSTRNAWRSCWSLDVQMMDHKRDWHHSRARRLNCKNKSVIHHTQSNMSWHEIYSHTPVLRRERREAMGMVHMPLLPSTVLPPCACAAQHGISRAHSRNNMNHIMHTLNICTSWGLWVGTTSLLSLRAINQHWKSVARSTPGGTVISRDWVLTLIKLF
jgi:hypothetical protein